VRIIEDELPHAGGRDLGLDRVDAGRAETLDKLLVPDGSERDVVDRPPVAREAEGRRMRVVRRTFRDVQADDAVDGKPLAGEWERRALRDLEPERVAVEGPRRLEVVCEHEHVFEPVEWHQPPVPAG
jgi:hypothetical protein